MTRKDMNQRFFIKIIQHKKTWNLKIFFDSLSLCTQTYSYIINASKHPFQASHPQALQIQTFLQDTLY